METAQRGGSLLTLLFKRYEIDQTKYKEMCGTFVTYGAKEKCIHKSLVWKAEGERELGRLRRKWEYNNTTDITELGRRCKLYSPGS